MQSIISKGKNVDEAIYLGLEQLDARKSEVDIQILQLDRNGFIGIGRKEAIVKLSLNEKPNENSSVREMKEGPLDSVESLLENMNLSDVNLEDPIRQNEIGKNNEQLLGKAWITDNKLYVKDSPSQFATVSIGKGVQLFKNQQLVKQKSTVISEKDELEIQLDEAVENETKWSIALDTSKLNAILTIEPGFRITKNLVDVEPNEHIELNALETKEVFNNLEYTSILSKLEDLRVVYGFHHNQIMEAVNATEPRAFTIATGKNAQDGKNGWFEPKVELNPMNGLVEDESGNVNFRDAKLVPTVEKGSIIGIIHPPVPGTPGVTVTNEPLPAKQTHPLKVVVGKGMEIVGEKVVATESGRPFVEQRGQLVKVKIVPKLFHPDNVNIASGNIRFRGDVEITGEVEENMLVEAEGDIFIHKSVSTATLTTLNSIVIKANVIGSDLAAGKNNMLVVELGHLLGIMHKQLEHMIAVIKQLMESPAFKSTDFSITGLQPLIMILLEKKFQNFLPYAKSYQEVVEKGQVYLEEDKWVHIGLAIKQIFLSLSNQVTTLNRLMTLKNDMLALSEHSQLPVEPNAFITLSDTINSKLYCSGDISIVGKGCINSKVHAGGKLKVNGVVRGGEVYGRLGVAIKEIGSTSGVKTIVAVPEDQKIQINKAYEGTVLKIGKVTTVIKDERNHILARLNENGTIIYE